MNEILRIIELRELYVYILLFKIYIETEGRIDDFCNYLERDVQLLFGEQFIYDNYLTAQEYLISEGLTNEDGDGLTPYGRKYIEIWARNFETLTEDEKSHLQTKLPPKVFEFFKFTEMQKPF